MFSDIIDFDVQDHPDVLSACVKAEDAYRRYSEAMSVAVSSIMKVKHGDDWQAATRAYFEENPV